MKFGFAQFSTYGYRYEGVDIKLLKSISKTTVFKQSAPERSTTKIFTSSNLSAPSLASCSSLSLLKRKELNKKNRNNNTSGIYDDSFLTQIKSYFVYKLFELFNAFAVTTIFKLLLPHTDLDRN